MKIVQNRPISWPRTAVPRSWAPCPWVTGRISGCCHFVTFCQKSHFFDKKWLFHQPIARVAVKSVSSRLFRRPPLPGAFSSLQTMKKVQKVHFFALFRTFLNVIFSRNMRHEIISGEIIPSLGFISVTGNKIRCTRSLPLASTTAKLSWRALPTSRARSRNRDLYLVAASGHPLFLSRNFRQRKLARWLKSTFKGTLPQAEALLGLAQAPNPLAKSASRFCCVARGRIVRTAGAGTLGPLLDHEKSRAVARVIFAASGRVEKGALALAPKGAGPGHLSQIARSAARRSFVL